MDKNQKVARSELKKIRNLEDFDLIMLISEIHDHGWPMARRTLCLMPPEDKARYKWFQDNTSSFTSYRSWNNAEDWLKRMFHYVWKSVTNGLNEKEAHEYLSRHFSKTIETSYPPPEPEEQPTR